MSKAKILGFVGGAAGAAFFTYAWFQIGVNYERTRAAAQQRIRERALIKVALTVKYPDKGYLFSEISIPIDGQVVTPTDIGTLTFKHESPK